MNGKGLLVIRDKCVVNLAPRRCEGVNLPFLTIGVRIDRTVGVKVLGSGKGTFVGLCLVIRRGNDSVNRNLKGDGLGTGSLIDRRTGHRIGTGLVRRQDIGAARHKQAVVRSTVNVLPITKSASVDTHGIRGIPTFLGRHTPFHTGLGNAPALGIVLTRITQVEFDGLTGLNGRGDIRDCHRFQWVPVSVDNLSLTRGDDAAVLVFDRRLKCRLTGLIRRKANLAARSVLGNRSITRGDRVASAITRVFGSHNRRSLIGQEGAFGKRIATVQIDSLAVLVIAKRDARRWHIARRDRHALGGDIEICA